MNVQNRSSEHTLFSPTSTARGWAHGHQCAVSAWSQLAGCGGTGDGLVVSYLPVNL